MKMVEIVLFVIFGLVLALVWHHETVGKYEFMDGIQPITCIDDSFKPTVLLNYSVGKNYITDMETQSVYFKKHCREY